MVSNASHRTTKRATNPGTTAKLLICFISFSSSFPIVPTSKRRLIGFDSSIKVESGTGSWCGPAPTITRLIRSASNISSCVLQSGPPWRLPTGLRDLPFHVASDRKSTRLNSSHQIISYAVFCLKKKKIDQQSITVKARDRLTTDEHQNDIVTRTREHMEQL